MNFNSNIANTKDKNDPLRLPKTIYFDGPFIDTSTDIDMKIDCEHCGKKNVCKYKERVEEAIEHFDNLFNGDDEQFAVLPLVTEIKCKEFIMGYTGIR